MRPLIKRAKDGVIAFDGNVIVRRLLDEATKRGFGLNELAGLHHQGLLGASQVAWEEFYQLIGYSLRGYHELGRVSDESALAASKKAQETFPDAKGCRDDGCPVHMGGDEE